MPQAFSLWKDKYVSWVGPTYVGFPCELSWTNMWVVGRSTWASQPGTATKRTRHCARAGLVHNQNNKFDLKLRIFHFVDLKREKEKNAMFNYENRREWRGRISSSSTGISSLWSGSSPEMKSDYLLKELSHAQDDCWYENWIVEENPHNWTFLIMVVNNDRDVKAIF